MRRRTAVIAGAPAACFGAALLLSFGFIACSDNAIEATAPPSAGAPSGNVAGTGGAPAATGGSSGAAPGGAGGGTSGSSAGQSTQSGSASGGHDASMSGSGGAATSGSGGQTAAGSGGLAGGAAKPGAELNGESWTMKCSKPDSDPGAADRCWLLPEGQDTCPAAGYTSLDKILHFGGTPGTTYQVTLHFEGTHEAGDYSGGTKLANEFLKNATHASGGLHTWLSMEVSSPAATYNPNAGGNGGMVRTYDYKVTIPIDGGATVHLKAFDIDCLMHRYCQDNVLTPCKGYVLAGISPAGAPIDGSFLRMTVDAVTPM